MRERATAAAAWRHRAAPASPALLRRSLRATATRQRTAGSDVASRPRGSSVAAASIVVGENACEQAAARARRCPRCSPRHRGALASSRFALRTGEHDEVGQSRHRIAHCKLRVVRTILHPERLRRSETVRRSDRQRLACKRDARSSEESCRAARFARAVDSRVNSASKKATHAIVRGVAKEKRRHDQRCRKAPLDRKPRQRHGIVERGRPATRHHAINRQGVRNAFHKLQPLPRAERHRFTGRSEHVNAVAAALPATPIVWNRARRIRRELFPHRRNDGRPYPADRSAWQRHRGRHRIAQKNARLAGRSASRRIEIRKPKLAVRNREAHPIAAAAPMPAASVSAMPKSI